MLVTTFCRRDGHDVHRGEFQFPLSPGSVFDTGEPYLMGWPLGFGDTGFYEEAPDDKMLLLSVPDEQCKITPKQNVLFSKGTVLFSGTPREMGVILPVFLRKFFDGESEGLPPNFIARKGEGTIWVGDGGEAIATNSPEANDAWAAAGANGLAFASGGSVPAASAGVGGIAIAEGDWGIVFVPMGSPKACGEVHGRHGYVRVREAPLNQESPTVSPIVILQTWWGKTKVFDNLTPGLWRLNWLGKPVRVKV